MLTGRILNDRVLESWALAFGVRGCPQLPKPRPSSSGGSGHRPPPASLQRTHTYLCGEAKQLRGELDLQSHKVATTGFHTPVTGICLV